MTFIRFFPLLTLLALLSTLLGCSGPDSTQSYYSKPEPVAMATVTYDANGATEGSPPASQSFSPSDPTWILGNTRGLAKTGFLFSGWNTAANGSGTSYAPGAKYIHGLNLKLYAVWNIVVTVTGVTLSPSTDQTNLSVGDILNFAATVNPANATDKSITWTSSVPTVATVSPPGVVTAAGPGTSTITVTTSDGAKTASVSVTVLSGTTPVTEVSLSQTILGACRTEGLALGR